MVKRCVAAALTTVIFCILTACGGGQDAVVGTWIVDKYDNGEDIISTEEIGEIYGETTYEFNKYSMIFTKSGNLTMIRPDLHGGTIESKYAYTVQDDYIEVYDPDEPSKFELVDYEDGIISFEVSSDLLVLLKKK